MLSRSSKWISFSLIAIVIGVLGCRSQMPVGNLFQVTKRDAVDLPGVEPPRQRLASARPRAGIDPAAENVFSASDVFANDAGDSTPDEATQSSTARTRSRRMDPAERERRTHHTVATRSPSEKMPRDAEAQTAKAPSRNKANPNDTDPKNAQENLSDDELMAAFEGTSPEVKEQALRQLIAVLSRSAESTAQPAPLDQAFRESLKREHDLPAAKNEIAAEPVKRLAHDQAPQEEAGNAARSQQKKQSNVVITYENPTKADPTKASPTEPNQDVPRTVANASAMPELEETVVESITDIAKNYPIHSHGSVKPVSATSSDQASSPVATASMQAKASSAPAGGASSVEGVSDQVLYETLLKRVASPVAGESEAERARRMITARHLMVLAGNPDQAVEKIEGMTDKEQEYLRHQLLGLWTMVDPEGHPVQSRRFSSALPQLREATKYLAAATDALEVRSLAFCTEILAYGQVKPFASKRFQPGQQVILYCEVENFIARKNDEGFQTHLQGSYDILDANNQKVASQLLPADQQTSANYLRDYFIAYQMHLPQQIGPGAYRLQLTMEDVEGKKYGQASISFEITK
ncbi:hypothetical protein Pla52o_07480 [Novipirellula galeiformis]|uniref:Uncharacterized protein n=1 Tax=Novipirellula galeiformis TaxID=2528004 RepID=A0A5C6CPI3_9BACT|nr:hypothetical protein [Novipirellula galeiformis]TWU26893.1 hypothetical protein Pla52o_07480 [Novipirellula galeiformis]